MEKILMEQKKTEKKEKQENKQTKEGKKVSTGAWWKSASLKGNKGDEAPSQGSGKKEIKPQRKKTVSGTKKTVRSEATPSTEATKVQGPGREKKSKPLQKRGPYRKKSVPAKAETSPVNTSDQKAASLPKQRSTAQKRSSRPDSRSLAKAKVDAATVDAVVPQSDVSEPKPQVRKPGRKRPTRRGRPAKKKVAVTQEGTEAGKETRSVQHRNSPRTAGQKGGRKTPPVLHTGPRTDRPVSAVEIVTPGVSRKEKDTRRYQPRKRLGLRREAKAPLEMILTASLLTPESQPESKPIPVETESGRTTKKAVDGRKRRGTRGEVAASTPKSRDAGERPLEKSEKQEPKPTIKLLINAEEPEECRLALLEDGRLESIHVATVSRAHTKNNIYKAKIVAIEANLQAAFVEYGTEKNGFLPFSEIHPEYYKHNVSDKIKKLIDQHQWKKLNIRDVVERGQEVLVQVVKEEVGKKGANMTTYLSLPGRCVVLMPGSDSTGISRKISGEERRSQLREYVKSIEIPEGIGWIVRTASIDITKAALSRDVSYLLRLWEDVKKKGQDLQGVGLIYQDHNHVLRFLREHFDPDIQEILVDDREALEQVEGFVELLPSKQRNVRIKLHRGARPIFNQYSIEDQIESIYQPKVNLPSGGSIVIDPTEALVAIDVNSGSTSKGHNFEESIFQANMEAAKELARQLRLRDLGGLIVVDFIDMRMNKNIREVERQVKTAMKRDKAKVDISRISKFGLMQISRQKLGAPIEAGNYRVCTHCKGRGIVRSVETLALYYLRRIHTGATRKVVTQVECRFPLDVAQYLLNYKRNELRELEGKFDAEVIIIADPSYKPADNEIIFHKSEKDDPSQKRS